MGDQVSPFVSRYASKVVCLGSSRWFGVTLRIAGDVRAHPQWLDLERGELEHHARVSGELVESID
jgi:hypothetical protein